MGLIYLDSFDGYTTAEEDRYWYNNAAGITGFISTGTDARTGTACARPGVSGWARGMQNPGAGFPITNPYGTGVGSLQNMVVIGAAVKIDGQNSNFIFRFCISTAAALGHPPDGDLLHIFTQGALLLKPDRTLGITYDFQPNAIEVAHTDPSHPIRQSIYHYIEWKVQFGHLGYSEVRIDDEVVQSGNVMETDVPLVIGTQTTINHDKAELFMISGGGGGGAPVAYDDLYIVSTDGNPVNVDFLTDSRVQVFMPSGPGGNSAWTPVGSATNWQNVNEIPSNDNTTYNTSTTSGNIDDYAHSTITSVTDVLSGVQMWQRVETDGTGSRTFDAIVNDGGATLSTNTQTGNAGTYVDFQDMFDTNIAISASWTAGNFNSTTFGLEDLG